MNRLLCLCAGLLALTAGCGGGGGDAATTAPPAPALAPVAAVNVSLSASTLAAGTSGSATAALADASGRSLSGRAVTWTSSAPSVATIDASGAVTAIATGATTITATSEGRAGSAQLTVIPPPVATAVVTTSAASIVAGSTASATVVLRDASGAALTGRSVTWTSSAPAVATVDASGVITGVSAGSTSITASSEGRSGSVSITVTPAPVATVVVTLSSATMVAGDLGSAIALLRDARGTTLSGRAVVWNSTNPSVATVSSSGSITTVSAGTASISATSEGQVGSAQLTVVPPPVATVTVSLAATVAAGNTTNASVILRDANGNSLGGRNVSWTSASPSVATVSASGVVTGIEPGVSTITATSEGKSGSANLTVTAPPVATVVITGSTRVKAGDSYTYSATARLANGTIVNRPVSWSIRESTRGLMTASGTLTPSQAGAITVQATIDGAVWESNITAYDWEHLSITAGEYISLYADNTITNKFGNSEYAELVFVCASTGNFFGWVSTNRFVTQNGLVALSFDGATPSTQTWRESSDFNTLFKPGNNLTVKTLAQQIAAARNFTFGFTEFQSTVKVSSFRVTGMPARLAPILARCPSNSIVASARADSNTVSDAEILQRALGTSSSTSELLAAQRQLRAARGVSSDVAPSLAGLRAADVSTQQARRRP